MIASTDMFFWVDAFEKPRLRGRRHRLFGPGAYPAVRSLRGEMGIAIQSLIVGPTTAVRLYRSDTPETVGHWLRPRKVVTNLSFWCRDELLDSIEVIPAKELAERMHASQVRAIAPPLELLVQRR